MAGEEDRAPETPEGPGRWLVDAMNVIGSRPDGWWRDRAGAARRLVEQLDRFAETTGEPVIVVLDGGEAPPAERAEVVVASRRGRDAADDEIVALLRDRGAEGARVVTSDAELARRVRELGAEVEGAGGFRRRLDEAG
jgi:predicted RNA-binding protein with PIN domain